MFRNINFCQHYVLLIFQFFDQPPVGIYCVFCTEFVCSGSKSEWPVSWYIMWGRVDFCVGLGEVCVKAHSPMYVLWSSAIGYSRALLLLKGLVCRIGWQMIVSWFLTDWLKQWEQFDTHTHEAARSPNRLESITFRCCGCRKVLQYLSKAARLMLGMCLR